jgi:hypothetical protein
MAKLYRPGEMAWQQTLAPELEAAAAAGLAAAVEAVTAHRRFPRACCPDATQRRQRPGRGRTPIATMTSPEQPYCRMGGR